MSLFDLERGRRPDRDPTTKASDVIAKIESFNSRFDLSVLSEQLSRFSPDKDAAPIDLKEVFKDSFDQTLNLLTTLRLTRWGDSHIKNNSLRRVATSHQTLSSSFELEERSFLMTRPEYVALRAQFEVNTHGIDEHSSTYHKHAGSFEIASRRLVDQTIVWNMRKFIGKMGEALQRNRRPSDVRGRICAALDILGMGISGHFPLADKSLSAQPALVRSRELLIVDGLPNLATIEPSAE
jgi:hypothetical protein